MDNEAPIPVNSCQSDVDCVPVAIDCGPIQQDCPVVEGQCDEALGACVDPSLIEGPVVIQVIDPETGESSDHRLDATELNAAESPVLTIADHVVVRGMVDDSRPISPSPVPVPAGLTFRRQSQFAGLSTDPISVTATGTQTADRRSNYGVSLLPGTYEVEVEPTSEADDLEHLYYPIRKTVVISPDESGITYVDFRYDQSVRRISGKVVDSDGTPQGGIRVYATDASHEERISNIAITECSDEAPSSCGHFTVVVPPETDTFLLRIQGGEENPLFPELSRGDYSFAQRDPDGNGEVDLGDVQYPALGEPILVRAIVMGEDRSGVEQPVEESSLVFRAETIGGIDAFQATARATAATDSSGEVYGAGLLGRGSRPGIHLLAGHYVVSVSPPPESEYAGAEIEIDVEPPATPGQPLNVTFQLGAKRQLSGSILAPDATPVPLARVEAIDPDGHSFAATGDEEGLFALSVDPGRYDLHITTPEQSNLPWAHIPGLSVFMDLDESVLVSWGTPLHGFIQHGALGLSAPTFYVQAYVERGGTFVRVGRAQTDADGAFTILVPRY